MVNVTQVVLLAVSLSNLQVNVYPATHHVKHAQFIQVFVQVVRLMLLYLMANVFLVVDLELIQPMVCVNLVILIVPHAWGQQDIAHRALKRNSCTMVHVMITAQDMTQVGNAWLNAQLDFINLQTLDAYNVLRTVHNAQVQLNAQYVQVAISHILETVLTLAQ